MRELLELSDLVRVEFVAGDLLDPIHLVAVRLSPEAAARGAPSKRPYRFPRKTLGGVQRNEVIPSFDVCGGGGAVGGGNGADSLRGSGSRKPTISATGGPKKMAQKPTTGSNGASSRRSRRHRR